MTPRNFDDFIRRDLEREIAHHERLAKKQQSQKPPAPEPTSHFLSQVPPKPLTWLWPGRIPFGHLTLLDAAPGSALSLLALSLAASISSGSPLPDGTPTQAGYVLLLAPYDAPSDTLKPRLQAAEADLSHVLLVHPLLEDASKALSRSRPYAFPHDLDHLAGLIRTLGVRLVIIDPATAIPGLVRCLPALAELARQTSCAIVLTRSLGRSPADPLHAAAPASPLLQAARSRLLLSPDPSGDGHHLLLTTKQALCTQPAILAYTILASEADIPTIHWLGERDHDQLTRLCTGPLRSPYRQAILHFLQHRDAPQTIPDILAATSYDREAGRKMLLRMKMAGELVSPARGLYTIAQHPCLLHLTDPPPPVPNVPNVSSVASPQSPALANVSPSDVPNVSSVSSVPISQSPAQANSSPSDVPNVPSAPLTDHTPNTLPPVPNVSSVPSPQNPTLTNSPQSDVPNVPSVSNVPTSQSPPLTNLPQNDVSPVLAAPVTHPSPSTFSPVPTVPNVPGVSNPARNHTQARFHPRPHLSSIF